MGLDLGWKIGLVMWASYVSHKVSLKPKGCTSNTLIQKASKNEPKHGPKNGTAWQSHFWDRMHSLVKEQKKMIGKDQAPIVIMAYVDDLLVATTSESAVSAHVKVRETDRVGLKGGHLRFLGRSIFRRPGSSALHMEVDPTCLDEAFAEFDLKKGSTTFPDLRPILEQEGSQPLLAEGHARFRRVLGRLSWYCQTRQDLLILVSMLGTGQTQPFESHEKCLRAVLKYLITDMDVALRFPSEELALPRCPRGPVGIAALLCHGQTAGGGSIPRWSASKPQVW